MVLSPNYISLFVYFAPHDNTSIRTEYIKFAFIGKSDVFPIIIWFQTKFSSKIPTFLSDLLLHWTLKNGFLRATRPPYSRIYIWLNIFGTLNLGSFFIFRTIACSSYIERISRLPRLCFRSYYLPYYTSVEYRKQFCISYTWANMLLLPI